MALTPGLGELRAEAIACTRCPLSEKRRQVVFGYGKLDAGLMIVGEAPGVDEDAQGRPFVGRAGKALDALMAEAGIDWHDAYVMNVVMCRPPGNRRPRVDEIAACAPYLDAQIRLVRPRVVLALGATATQRLLGRGVTVTASRGIPRPRGDAVVIPTFHPSPSALNRVAGRRAMVSADFRLAHELASSPR